MIPQSGLISPAMTLISVVLPQPDGSVNGYRPQRAEVVERLAEMPLLVALLPVACGHVVEDGVTPDVVQRVGPGDGASALADDDRQLRLVVQCIAHARRIPDAVAVRDHRLRHLGEHDRAGRNRIGRRLVGIEAALGELLRVVGVVLADAEQVTGRLRDRCEQPHRGQIQRRGIALERR